MANNPDPDQSAAAETILKILDTCHQSNALLVASAGHAADFAQLALKSCLTVNSGGILILPALVKVLIPGQLPAPVSDKMIAACALFILGIVLAVAADFAAFVITIVNTRTMAKVIYLPALQAQARHAPQTMDDAQTARLKNYTSLVPTAESRTLRNTAIGALICALSFACFCTGSIIFAIVLLGAQR